jgi:hypothetical protein
MFKLKNQGISPDINRLVIGTKARIRVMPVIIKLIVFLLCNLIGTSLSFRRKINPAIEQIPALKATTPSPSRSCGATIASRHPTAEPTRFKAYTVLLCESYFRNNRLMINPLKKNGEESRM